MILTQDSSLSNGNGNDSIPSDTLAKLAPESRRALSRLQEQGIDVTDLSEHLPKRLAAVLVLLYEQAGVLRVLLTTRSKQLRSHPGQTALPGGRVDATDKDAIETAFREANEEVSLPLSSRTPQIHTLGSLSPHLSQWGLVVTPVIAFLSDNSILDSLKANPDEVDRIFTHPLEAILDPELLCTEENLVEIGSSDWPYKGKYYDHSDRLFPDLGNTVYRMHRFRSTASSVKGLTAEILMRVAVIAYDKPPTLPIEQYAPGQIHGFAEISAVLKKYQGSRAE